MFDRIIQITKEHQWLLLTVLSGIGMILVLFGHIIPGFVEVHETQAEIRTCENKIAQAAQWQSNAEELEQNTLRLRNQIRQFVFQQKQDTHQSMMIQFLSKVSDENGVTIAGIEPGEVIKEKQHFELPVHLKLETTFHKLGRFINRLENAEHIIRIHDLKINSNRMTSSKLDIDIILHVYYLTE